MTDPIEELQEVLNKVGARPTLDMLANVQHPCWRCSAPGPHELYVCGTQDNGAPKRRPFCPDCHPAARATNKQRLKFLGRVCDLIDHNPDWDMKTTRARARSKTWRSRLAFWLVVEISRIDCQNGWSPTSDRRYTVTR